MCISCGTEEKIEAEGYTGVDIAGYICACKNHNGLNFLDPRNDTIECVDKTIFTSTTQALAYCVTEGDIP